MDRRRQRAPLSVWDGIVAENENKLRNEKCASPNEPRHENEDAKDCAMARPLVKTGIPRNGGCWRGEDVTPFTSDRLSEAAGWREESKGLAEMRIELKQMDFPCRK